MDRGVTVKTRRSDEVLLSEMYRRHRRQVAAVVRRSGVSEADVEDVVHNVFLALHRKRADRPEHVATRQWAAAEARRAAFSHRRAAARRYRRTARVDPPLCPNQPADEWYAGVQDRERLRQAVAGLPAAQRQIFLAMEFGHQTAPELALELELPLDTIYSRLRLARQKLHRALSLELQPPSAQKQRSFVALVAAGRWPRDLLMAGAFGVVILLPFAGWLIDPPPAPARSGIGIGLVNAKGNGPPPSSSLAPQPSSPLPSNEDVRSEPRASASASRPAAGLRVKGIPKGHIAVPDDPLAREVQRLASVRRASRKGQHREGLRRVDEYIRAHPKGALRKEVLELGTTLACALGEDEKAASYQHSLAELHPGGTGAKKRESWIPCDGQGVLRRNAG